MGLETTLIGAQDLKSENVPEDFAKSVDSRFHREASWASFNAAMAQGVSNLTANDKKFNTDEEPGYRLIHIAEARELGILPIGHETQKKTK